MLLSDRQIAELCTRWNQPEKNMIHPFINRQVREFNGRKFISYGVSSYGYDLRLSPTEFKIYRHVPGTVVNPKRPDLRHFYNADLHTDADGRYFILPGNSYGLGVAVERLNLPPHVTAICMGKSTYARVGVIANVTPAEAGWVGNLTLEFSNSSDADVRIYADEGVVQLLFLMGDEVCETSYADRKGKYMNQTEEVTLPRL